MSASKLERLLNLTALLLDASRPVPAEDVQRQIPGYPDDRTAFRRAFERDKEELRAMGVPLVVEKVPGRLPEVDGYRIPKEQYYLRDPELAPDELTALHLAASAVRVEGLPAQEGLLKLGGGSTQGLEPDAAVAVASLPADPNLTVLFGATAERRSVLLTYNGEDRTIDPYRLEYQRGHWYLSGFDHVRGEERSYRLDRIEGAVTPTELPPFDPPTSAVPGVALAPWQLGEDEPRRARLRVDPPQAPWAVQHVGPDNVVEESDDGSVVVELPVTNRNAFRSFVLSFLEHAELLEPTELRDDLVRWLEPLAEGPG
jgi:proteasome accessory factor B